MACPVYKLVLAKSCTKEHQWSLQPRPKFLRQLTYSCSRPIHEAWFIFCLLNSLKALHSSCIAAERLFVFFISFIWIWLGTIYVRSGPEIVPIGDFQMPIWVAEIRIPVAHFQVAQDLILYGRQTGDSLHPGA